MTEHEPSDLIQLHDGMVLSFINYEIRVNFQKKESADLNQQNARINQQQQNIAEAVA